MVYHAADEPNLPANVDWFLGRTSLWFCDKLCNPSLQELIVEHPSQSDLIQHIHPADCGAAPFDSAGTRSTKKQRTFFLADLSDADRRGSLDPGDWTTYYHAYPNDIGGVTIQYWRFHPYNTGKTVKTTIFGMTLTVEFGFHGGDWEGIHVVLAADETPTVIRLIGHTDIQEVPWASMEIEDTHPVVYSEKEGHATLAQGSRDGIRQETWGSDMGAKVTWPGQAPVNAGTLLNVGEKTNPLNNQTFIQYSGLWGTPSTFPDSSSIIYYASSGYWGPAFNETEMQNDGFIKAWGAGAANPALTVNGVPEFYATSTTR